jgi:hypothetical protein
MEVTWIKNNAYYRWERVEKLNLSAFQAKELYKLPAAERDKRLDELEGSAPVVET